MLHSALGPRTDFGLSYLTDFESVDIVNFVYRKYGSAKPVTLCSIAAVMICLFLVGKK